jgi:hypothetical protein
MVKWLSFERLEARKKFYVIILIELIPIYLSDWKFKEFKLQV